jgi:transcriptional regulator with XRE-family HTH domain
MSTPNRPQLGHTLRTARRRQHMSLRDLADLIGVSVNTLSRVERGQMPDLKNYQRIVEWLEVPADTFLETDEQGTSPDTLDLVLRHFRSDAALTPQAVEQLTSTVTEMYRRLTAQPRLAVHMRSARMFSPEAGSLLAQILADMQATLEAEEKS